jgi:HD superfamily phosphohydrolase
MTKLYHEIRDPIHVFIQLDSDERRVLDSAAFQRLRYVHQLALTYLIYPAATHKRFEHSLGAMDLVTKVFDVVTAPENVTDEVRQLVPEISDPKKRNYWRGVVRMAAMCHDIGHLPFSHAAEHLLPAGWDHERLTNEIITSGEMKSIWESMTPPLRGTEIAKLAVGKKKIHDEKITFSNWEAILSELIVSDVFGVDRMDYLLRDSLHTGVAYGKFDHHRLAGTLRVLSAKSGESLTEPKLGVEIGGLQAAESLLIARYMMFSQMYYHPVRLVYDIHLEDFLKQYLAGGGFSTDLTEHAKSSDFEIITAIIQAAYDSKSKGHDAAERIMRRKHFRVLYERLPEDIAVNPEAGKLIFEAAKKEFGEENVRHKKKAAKGELIDFPVLMRDGSVASALAVSAALPRIPELSFEYVFVAPELVSKSRQWLKDKKAELIKAEVAS